MKIYVCYRLESEEIEGIQDTFHIGYLSEPLIAFTSPEEAEQWIKDNPEPESGRWKEINLHSPEEEEILVETKLKYIPIREEVLDMMLATYRDNPDALRNIVKQFKMDPTFPNRMITTLKIITDPEKIAMLDDLINVMTRND